MMQLRVVAWELARSYDVEGAATGKSEWAGVYAGGWGTVSLDGLDAASA